MTTCQLESLRPVRPLLRHADRTLSLGRGRPGETKMSSRLWIAAIAIAGLTACNYDEGPCRRRGQGGGNAGVGGSIIVPNGAGGFGDVPPQPQDAAEAPVCNITDPPELQKNVRGHVRAVPGHRWQVHEGLPWLRHVREIVVLDMPRSLQRWNGVPSGV